MSAILVKSNAMPLSRWGKIESYTTKSRRRLKRRVNQLLALTAAIGCNPLTEGNCRATLLECGFSEQLGWMTQVASRIAAAADAPRLSESTGLLLATACCGMGSTEQPQMTTPDSNCSTSLFGCSFHRSSTGTVRAWLTTEFSSGAGCEDFMPRKAVMPAPSAATAGSACPWLVEHHRTTSHPRRQPRVGQPCRGQACADTPAAPWRAGTRRQRPGGACPRRSAVRSPPAASGSAPR